MLTKILVFNILVKDVWPTLPEHALTFKTYLLNILLNNMSECLDVSAELDGLGANTNANQSFQSCLKKILVEFKFWC